MMFLYISVNCYLYIYIYIYGAQISLHCLFLNFRGSTHRLGVAFILEVE